MSLGRKGLLYALIPLVALAVLLFGIQRYGGSGFGFSEVPPIEELTFEWTTLKPGEIKLDVVNGGLIIAEADAMERLARRVGIQVEEGAAS